MAILGAGTLFNIEHPIDSGTFITINGTKSIGATGSETPLVDVTTLADTSRVYISGIEDGAEKEIKLNYEKGDPDQTTFRDAAKARETRLCQIVYPNGVTGEFSLVLQGFSVDETSLEDAIMCTIKGKISGPVSWTEAA